MPDSVIIDAVRYAILRVKEPLILEGRACNAVVEYNTAQIKILEGGNIGEGNAAKLLMHEIVHALLFERGMPKAAADEELVSELAAGFVNSSLAVDKTRAVKDEEEKEKMRSASAVNDAAMARLRALVHAGVTEREIRDQLLGIYQELGAQGFSFTPLVAFGANAADPHHEPDDTVLREGDCVLFDVGCVKDGYCSDMTRTFYYKSVSDHCREVYETTRAANEAAVALIRPGVRLCDIDKAARDLITEKGYGPAFNHRLGHFIGLTDHEYGDVSSAFDWEVEPGMIFSIEPGIYLVGDTGVRVEDLVMVTEDGVELLNHYSHDLDIIN